MKNTDNNKLSQENRIIKCALTDNQNKKSFIYDDGIMIVKTNPETKVKIVDVNITNTDELEFEDEWEKNHVEEEVLRTLKGEPKDVKWSHIEQTNIREFIFEDNEDSFEVEVETEEI